MRTPQPDDRILVETHAHAAEVSACSLLPAARLVRLAAENGYGAVVITDHYLAGQTDTPAQRKAFTQGYLRAKEAGEALGVTVLPGMELRFADHGYNDFLVYLPDEALYHRLTGLAYLSPQTFRKLADDEGMLFYQAHPFRPGLYPVEPACLHGVEVHNGNPNHDSHNDQALAFAQQYGLAMLSGSDLHEEIGVRRGGIWAPRAAIASPQAFVDYLRRTPHPDRLEA